MCKASALLQLQRVTEDHRTMEVLLEALSPGCSPYSLIPGVAMSFPNLGTWLGLLGPQSPSEMQVEEQAYLVPHVQHFLGVSVERHKLVWVFDPYGHATAGLFHFISLHPLTRQVRSWAWPMGYPSHWVPPQPPQHERFTGHSEMLSLVSEPR